MGEYNPTTFTLTSKTVMKVEWNWMNQCRWMFFIMKEERWKVDESRMKIGWIDVGECFL